MSMHDTRTLGLKTKSISLKAIFENDSKRFIKMMNFIYESKISMCIFKAGSQKVFTLL